MRSWSAPLHQKLDRDDATETAGFLSGPIFRYTRPAAKIYLQQKTVAGTGGNELALAGWGLSNT